jgi:predicted protein tyrosine phosphatase
MTITSIPPVNQYIEPTCQRTAAPHGMPDMAISTIWEAQTWASQFDSVVTVFSPAHLADFGHDDHLRVDFCDRTNPQEGAPTVEHIASVLAWAETRRDNSILVHCKAGQSRSVATAIAMLASWGIHEIDAVRLAFWNYRPENKLSERPFIPNKKVLEHADLLLGTDLMGAVADLGFGYGGYNLWAEW